jgi:hypothetical protein
VQVVSLKENHHKEKENHSLGCLVPFFCSGYLQPDIILMLSNIEQKFPWQKCILVTGVGIKFWRAGYERYYGGYESIP